jgi:hypothetical protein
MTASAAKHLLDARHFSAGPASSASPMQPAWASACVLGQLELAHPSRHLAAEPVI